MGQLDNKSENSSIGSQRNAEAALQAVTQELKSLQHNLIVQLGQDVKQLQTEKSQLLHDIARLRAYHKQLQTQQLDIQSKRQLAQQQLWAKQLAQALAVHLQEQLLERLNQLAANTRPPLSNSTPNISLSPPTSAENYSENAYRLLASLDTTFSTTFKALQQELNSYQSSLSQQLNRMHSMEQQGEAILTALVTHLREQLQAETLRLQAEAQAAAKAEIPSDLFPAIATNGNHPNGTTATTARPPEPPPFPTAPSVPPTPTTTPLPPPPAPGKQFSQVQLGLLMVLGSTMALSIHNVVVRIIGSPSQLLGLFSLGGFIKLGLGNSLLILWLRMLVVVPLMTFVAMILYPAVWRDLRKFLTSRDRRSIINVVGSGGFLFLSQILIYIAIGQIGPGVAVTILFMYPIVTVPLAWLLFGDRPSGLRFGVMIAIALGVILAAFPSISATGATSGVGIITAIISGVAFAFYLIFMQLGFKKLHPVPVSLVQFFTIFVLASLSLILPLPLGVEVLPQNRAGLVIGGIILGVLTLAGYLLNNFGVRFMGAARASIIASSGPVITALLAFLLIPGPQTALKPIQIAGILLVTCAVTALSFERMLGQNKAAKPAR